MTTTTKSFAKGLGLVCVMTMAACGHGGIGTPPPPPPPPQTYTIGGAVTGLAGSGLVLQNNGGNDLAVASSGNRMQAARRLAKRAMASSPQIALRLSMGRS